MGNSLDAGDGASSGGKEHGKEHAGKKKTKTGADNKATENRRLVSAGSSIHERISISQHAGDLKLHDYYEKVEHIAEGSTCQIWTVRKKEGSDQELYALKIISKSAVDDVFIREMRNEISILRTLDHPNIVRVFDVFESKREMYLVMEYCSGGDLYSKAPYSEAQAAMILTKILSAVAYMHKMKVIHRDLKPDNCIFESTADNAEPKIIDFGLSKQYVSDKYKMHAVVGTIDTMSPQVLKGEYTSKADLWAIGVIAYILLSGTRPFHGGTNKKIASEIIKGDFSFDGKEWQHVSQQAQDFCSKLLTYNPDQRPTATDALRDPWLRSTFSLKDRRPDKQVMTSVQNALLQSAQDSKFKKMIIMMIAYKSSTESIQQLRSAFDSIDTDNSGTISYWQFRNALKQCNYDDKVLKKIFSDIDVNATGVINYTEFLGATLETRGRIEDKRIAEAFDKLDVDKSGYISKENLCSVLGSECSAKARDALVDEILNEVDSDKDGVYALVA